MHAQGFVVRGLLLCSAAMLINPPTASAEDLKLSTGETLTVEILEVTDTMIIANHAVLGRLEISRDKIDGSIGDGIDVLNQPADEADALPEAEPKEKSYPWKSRFTGSFGVQSGNTDSQNLSASATTKRETDKTRINADARYFLGYDNGDRNDNKFTAGFIHDWLFADSPWSVFVDGRYDYDEFNSWESRLSGHGGLGYQLIKEEDLDLLLRFGAGGAKEFHSKRNQFIPEGLLGADLSWTISERQDFTASTTFYPDFDDTGEFRNVSTAAWNYKLADDSNLAIAIGLYNEYQSKVDPEREHNDLRLFGGLSFDF